MTAARSALASKVTGALSACLPPILFVGLYLILGFVAGLVAAVVGSACIFAARIVRREPLWQAAWGPSIVLLCTALALATGEARGFFLLPTVTPVVVLSICGASMLIGRPLAGYVINPVARGPRAWRDLPRFRALYHWATLVCVLVNVVNAALQIHFFRANNLAALATIHALTVPVFSVVVIATIGFVRRELRQELPTSGAAAERRHARAN